MPAGHERDHQRTNRSLGADNDTAQLVNELLLESLQ
jgi:hypothetical protein